MGREEAAGEAHDQGVWSSSESAVHRWRGAASVFWSEEESLVVSAESQRTWCGCWSQSECMCEARVADRGWWYLWFFFIYIMCPQKKWNSFKNKLFSTSSRWSSCLKFGKISAAADGLTWWLLHTWVQFPSVRGWTLSAQTFNLSLLHFQFSLVPFTSWADMSS